MVINVTTSYLIVILHGFLALYDRHTLLSPLNNSHSLSPPYIIVLIIVIINIVVSIIAFLSS